MLARDMADSLQITPKGLYKLANQIVCLWFANGSYTKCAYVSMGLQTYTALSTYSNHAVGHEEKFVGFLH